MSLQCLAATAVIMGPLVVTVLLIAEVGTRWGELAAFLGVIPISLSAFLSLELVADFAADVSTGLENPDTLRILRLLVRSGFNCLSPHTAPALCQAAQICEASMSCCS